MPKTTGKGVPTNSVATGLPKGVGSNSGNSGLPGRTVSAVTGLPLGQGKAGGGAIAPSGSAALYPAGQATNRIARSVESIPVAKPRAGKTPNVHPVQRRR